MFSQTVISVFRFLEDEYRFKPVINGEREVQYEREASDTFINLSYTRLDEISIRVGRLSQGYEKGFSASVIVALSDARHQFSSSDKIASRSEQTEEALVAHASALKAHGGKILDGDPEVFEEMCTMIENRQIERADRQVRRDAQIAFAAKEFGKAAKYYRSLGDRRTRLDTKRLEICERMEGC